MELCGKVMPGCGVLVVRDPPDADSLVHGVLGTNVIRKCYKELFGLFGSSLFESSSVSGAPDAVVAALQQCHQSVTRDAPNFLGTVKIRGEQVVHIPGGVMQMVAATCPEQFSGKSTLFKPPEPGLPAGLLASPCLLKVVWGTVIQVFSSSVDQHLQRLEMMLGRLQREGLKAKLEKCAFFQQQDTFGTHHLK